jgi:hypothetical protein
MRKLSKAAHSDDFRADFDLRFPERAAEGARGLAKLFRKSAREH